MNTTIKLKLVNLAPGTEIVTITPQEKGFAYGPILLIGEFSETHGKWRLRREGSNRDSGMLPTSGKGYTWGSKLGDPPSFFYSANPKHIKAAKAAHKRNRLLLEKEAKETKLKLAKLEKEMKNLLASYGAELYAEQISGDDQGVEVGTFLTIKNQSSQLD